MAKYRGQLPQLMDRLFLTDGGIETTLIFQDGLELPHFAAYTLLQKRDGSQALSNYFETYARLARVLGTGIVLETPTWRASTDWGRHFGHDDRELAKWNEASVQQLEQIRDEWETATSPIVISGCVGPRGDGYDPGEMLTQRRITRRRLRPSPDPGQISSPRSR